MVDFVGHSRDKGGRTNSTTGRAVQQRLVGPRRRWAHGQRGGCACRPAGRRSRQLWSWSAARWLLWPPVLLATGIVAYFNLPGEPPSWAGWLAAGIALTLLASAYPAWRGQVAGREALLIGLAAVALGFALAQARLHAVAAPVLDARPRLRHRGSGDRSIAARRVATGCCSTGSRSPALRQRRRRPVPRQPARGPERL